MSAGADAYSAALYMRLSRDDEGTGESSSIGNQRKMLTAYAGEHGYYIASEYVDDGYSGTNFDRPGFQRMLADIEDRKINLVLTKDLSRLGRDYIQTGQYTEVYFPSKKVRYIAVNDGFDSESPYTDIAPFKHVVNEMYARDASRKIRSAFAVKFQNGSYIGNFAPYGYRKDPGNKNHLLADPESAAVVRELFGLAEDGLRPGEIAEVFNRRGVLPPALYRCQSQKQLDPDAYSRRKAWTASGISKLLRNIVYLGHMAQGKTTRVSFKSNLTLQNPPSDWVVVENTHEALITQAQFDAVQRRMGSRACPAKGAFFNLFSGLAKCADCGRNMSTVGTRKKGSPASLCCGGYKLYGGQECSNHFIDYNALYAIVLDAVRAQASLPQTEREALLRNLREEIGRGQGSGPAGERARLQGELAKTDRVIEQLYDDSGAGKLSPARFYTLLEKYEFQSSAVAKKIAALEAHGAEDADPQEAPGRLAALLARYANVQTLDADLLFALIDRIEVGQGRYEQTEGGRIKRQTVTIHFRFATQTLTKEIIL